MTKKANGLDIELGDEELDYLKKIHVAQTIADMMKHPGWQMVMDISSNMIERLENQHLNFAVGGGTMATRDAYWASGIRLGGARDFAMVLSDKIKQRIDILNQPLQPPTKPDLADFDGELNGNQ